MSEILVTGGSGFLGRAVIRRLIADGHRVTSLVRSAQSQRVVERLGARALSGDIQQVDKFTQPLADFSIVVHCAAPVEFWGPWEKYQQGIIDATLTLAKACAQQRVKRFIHISSESVLQDRDDLVDINETHPYPHAANSYYGQAKRITEEQLVHLDSAMEIIIIRPAFIWGPDCPTFATLSKKVRSREFVWIDQGRASFEAVHVENVAEAVRLALTHGNDREIYFLTDDERSTVREFFASLFDSLNLPETTRSMPKWLARAVACQVEFLWRTLRIKSAPPLTRFDFSFVAMSRRYQIDRAENDLRYRPVITRSDGFTQLGRECRSAIL